MMRFLVLIAVGAALVAGVARAGDMTCPWNAISDPAQRKVAQSYGRLGLAGAEKFHLSDLDFERLADDCLPAGASLARGSGPVRAAIESLFLWVMWDDTRARMSKAGLNVRLDEDAWRALKPADRAAVTRLIGDRDGGRAGDPAAQSLLADLLVKARPSGAELDAERRQATIDYFRLLAKIDETQARF